MSKYVDCLRYSEARMREALTALTADEPQLHKAVEKVFEDIDERFAVVRDDTDDGEPKTTMYKARISILIDPVEAKLPDHDIAGVQDLISETFRELYQYGIVDWGYSPAHECNPESINVPMPYEESSFLEINTEQDAYPAIEATLDTLALEIEEQEGRASIHVHEAFDILAAVVDEKNRPCKEPGGKVLSAQEYEDSRRMMSEEDNEDESEEYTVSDQRKMVEDLIHQGKLIQKNLGKGTHVHSAVGKIVDSLNSLLDLL